MPVVLYETNGRVLRAMRDGLRGCAGLALALGLIAGPVQAAPVLDAASVVPSHLTLVPFSTTAIAQTFTALNTGLLTEMDLYLSNVNIDGVQPAIFSVSLTTTVDGSPVGGTTLASFGFASSSVTSEGLQAFQFRTPAPVQAGGLYSFVISTATGDYLASVGFGGGGFGSTYADGAAFFGNSGLASATQQNYDLIFQTFVDPVEPVPEPSSTVPFCIALLCTAAMVAPRRPTRT